MKWNDLMTYKKWKKNTKKGKIIILFLTILTIAVIYRIISLNNSYPQKERIEKYPINDYVKTDKGYFMATKVDSINYDSNGFPIIGINFIIKNSSNNDVDISDLYYKFSMYRDFDKSDIQNIGNKFLVNDVDVSYKKEDLYLKAFEEKSFVFYYYCGKENVEDTFIHIDNSFYKDEFVKYIDEGILLFKVIDLGEIDV